MNDKIKTISTKNLDAMIADNYVKLAIFNRKESPYGWTKRDLRRSPYGVDFHEFDEEYVKYQVSFVYSVFPDEEINELIRKVNKYYEKNKCK